MSDAGYQVNAQYYDLIFPSSIHDTLAAGLRALLPGARTIVEIGPGTGRFTQEILALLPDGGELFAVEPSPAMRAALATRLTGLPKAADVVTVLPEDGLTARVGAPVDAVVVLNVLTHLGPDERARLWRHWAGMLTPSGLVIADAQFIQEPVDVPPTVAEGRRLGRRYYDTVMRARVLDTQRVLWAMTYRTHEGGEIVREETAEFDSYVMSDDRLDAELADAGFTAVPDRPDGVLAWRLATPTQ
ncbi:methyltransferase family protein [Herbihabitans rhizosphaerae]|uniref:Methyltransferase family protein n=1 Tax=Herbihabitans rhizosphaerae TaxID=1872711 RepID=A0A4Q7KQY4_9PSEU|nr:class I SAM-dependent methyltransferase [Herbihabitans rhizosphaerae]RZS38816.1 methyltransferase family protein [Herbihabitans rhizosphaerae]